jgi:predicted homoserine dehydrogenase-like protein
MYLSTVSRTSGIHLLGIAELDFTRADSSLKRVGYPMERVVRKGSISWQEACKTGQTILTNDSADLIGAEGIDVVCRLVLDPCFSDH